MAFIDELRNARTDDKVKELQERYKVFVDDTIEKIVNNKILRIKEDAMKKAQKGGATSIKGSFTIRAHDSFGLGELGEEMSKFNVRAPFIMEGIEKQKTLLLVSMLKQNSLEKGCWFWKKYENKIQFTEVGKEIIKSLQDKAGIEGIRLDFSLCRMGCGGSYGYDDYEYSIGFLKDGEYTRESKYLACDVKDVSKLSIPYEIVF